VLVPPINANSRFSNSFKVRNLYMFSGQQQYSSMLTAFVRCLTSHHWFCACNQFQPTWRISLHTSFLEGHGALCGHALQPVSRYQSSESFEKGHHSLPCLQMLYSNDLHPHQSTTSRNSLANQPLPSFSVLEAHQPLCWHKRSSKD